MTATERINKMSQQDKCRIYAGLMAKVYNWLYEYWQTHKDWFAFQTYEKAVSKQYIFPGATPDGQKGRGDINGFYCNLVRPQGYCCVQLRFFTDDFKVINRIAFHVCFTQDTIGFYKGLSDDLKEGGSYIKMDFQPQGTTDEEIKSGLFSLLDRTSEKFKKIGADYKLEMPGDGERHERIVDLVENGFLADEKGVLSVPASALFSSDGESSTESTRPYGTSDVKESNELGLEKNLIRFGAPGTGKSFAINEEYEKDWWASKERVTFHPDYSYANFVGAYKPYMMDDKNITYAFVPGPFTRVLVNALRDSKGKHLLVIEEINRANTAAVFGDIFQLLDRGKNGESEYAISPSQDLAKFLREALKQPKKNDDDWWWLTTEPLAEKEVEGTIRNFKIPSNMYLWATMNSADQGVFPMDTAFKRRWSFEYVGIDAGQDAVKGELAGEWNKLRQAINGQLVKALKVNEDKCMGPFFLSEGDLDKAAFLKVFKSKVLMYLFEDAARQKRSAMFADGRDTLSEIFAAVGKKEKVFKDDRLEEILDGIRAVNNSDQNETEGEVQVVTSESGQQTRSTIRNAGL